MIQAMYDMMNKKKKSEIAASYGKMMAAMNGDHDDKKDEAMHDDEKSKEKKIERQTELLEREIQKETRRITGHNPTTYRKPQD